MKCTSFGVFISDLRMRDPGSPYQVPLTAVNLLHVANQLPQVTGQRPPSPTVATTTAPVAASSTPSPAAVRKAAAWPPVPHPAAVHADLPADGAFAIHEGDGDPYVRAARPPKPGEKTHPGRSSVTSARVHEPAKIRQPAVLSHVPGRHRGQQG
jgi:hypothetical protein